MYEIYIPSGVTFGGDIFGSRNAFELAFSLTSTNSMLSHSLTYRHIDYVIICQTSRTLADGFERKVNQFSIWDFWLLNSNSGPSAFTSSFSSRRRNRLHGSGSSHDSTEIHSGGIYWWVAWSQTPGHRTSGYSSSRFAIFCQIWAENNVVRWQQLASHAQILAGETSNSPIASVRPGWRTPFSFLKWMCSERFR